jgi:hypothetical protein
MAAIIHVYMYACKGLYMHVCTTQFFIFFEVSQVTFSDGVAEYLFIRFSINLRVPPSQT